VNIYYKSHSSNSLIGMMSATVPGSQLTYDQLEVEWIEANIDALLIIRFFRDHQFL